MPSLLHFGIKRCAAVGLALAAVCSTLISNGFGSNGGVWKDETNYRVTITTSLDIEPKDGVDKVMVYHALPVERPWSPGEKRSSARNISLSPPDGKIKYDNDTDGPYVVWEVRVPKNGKQESFTTTYETTSVTRKPAEDLIKKARWSGKRLLNRGETHPEIFEQAELLSKEKNPVVALEKFSSWLRERIRYDASVNNQGVDDIMKNGAGHCGHRGEVMIEFAKALNIPVRLSSGSKLVHADGGTGTHLFALKPTWSNSHVWLEFDIPGMGWTEAEPIAGEKIFEIPHKYIKTRGYAQNFKVELLRDGRWGRPIWEFVETDGQKSFQSDVGLRNVISFENLGSKNALSKTGDGIEGAEMGESDNLPREEGAPASSFQPQTAQAGAAARRQTPTTGPNNDHNGRAETGVLTKSIKFTLKRDGFYVGSVTIAPGGSVDILGRSNNLVLVKRGISEPQWVDCESISAPSNDSR